MSSIDPVELNIRGVQQLVQSKLNKSLTDASTDEEGPQGEEVDELTLELSDQELLKLSEKWTATYAIYEKDIKSRQNKNREWYLGQKQSQSIATTEGEPISSNILFEAEETFIPAALAKNPEPQVWSDNTKEGDAISTTVKTMLQYHSDTLVLRSKLSLMVRHWSIYFIGIIKHSWDNEIQEIQSEIRDPQNFIFDPDGYVDVYGDMVGYLGERCKINASELIDMFPKHKEYILLSVDGKLGTQVTYTEWWNDEYCFYTYRNTVLDKHKNQFFNWPKKVPQQQPNMQTGEMDTIEVEQPQHNHFARAKKPYTFLSVFTLQKQPHDLTSLIEQNIPNQRRISRRTEQIDFNLSRQNNSIVYSKLAGWDEQTAKQAATAMAKGHPVIAPGSITDGIQKIEASAIPNAFFDELAESKSDLRSIFGVQGITASEPDKDQTARGMILRTQYDNSRIGGGIGDKLEQVADNIFNWWVQMYYVFYDEKHVASIMGQMKSVEYVTLWKQDLYRRLVVSVSPDSMAPRDEMSIQNQSISLYEMGVLDPKTLLTRLNFPDSQEVSEQAVLWLMDKNAYLQLNFPELAQKLQQLQQQQMQAQQQQQQMAMQQQAAQGQAQMQQGEQAHQQKLSQANQSHNQKISHKEQAFNQQQMQGREKAASQQSLSQSAPGASLSSVKIPK